MKTDNLEKIEILNKFFACVFTKDSLRNLFDFLFRTDKHSIPQIYLLILWGNILKKLKISKSVRPDNFHHKFLAETSENIKTP